MHLGAQAVTTIGPNLNSDGHANPSPGCACTHPFSHGQIYCFGLKPPQIVLEYSKFGIFCLKLTLKLIFLTLHVFLCTSLNCFELSIPNKTFALIRDLFVWTCHESFSDIHVKHTLFCLTLQIQGKAFCRVFVSLSSMVPALVCVGFVQLLFLEWISLKEIFSLVSLVQLLLGFTHCHYFVTSYSLWIFKLVSIDRSTVLRSTLLVQHMMFSCRYSQILNSRIHDTAEKSDFLVNC